MKDLAEIRGLLNSRPAGQGTQTAERLSGWRRLRWKSFEPLQQGVTINQSEPDNIRMQMRNLWDQCGLRHCRGQDFSRCACCCRLRLSRRSLTRRRCQSAAYVIDAELDPATHQLSAKAVVSFTAPENADKVNFGFHPALKVTKISDEGGKLLTSEREADGTIRVTPAAPFIKGQESHWTFEYEGVITGKDDGPEPGQKLAAIQEPISYLLYPARWFPSDRLSYQSLHSRDAHQRATGNEGLRKRRTGMVASGQAGQWRTGRSISTLTGASRAFPAR